VINNNIDTFAQKVIFKNIENMKQEQIKKMLLSSNESKILGYNSSGETPINQR